MSTYDGFWCVCGVVSNCRVSHALDFYNKFTAGLKNFQTKY